MRIVLSIVIAILCAISMVQAKDITVNLPGIKSIALSNDWHEMKMLNSLSKSFLDKQFNSLQLEYREGAQYRSGNRALKEIVSRTPHPLDLAERYSLTRTAMLYEYSKKSELKTIVSNGQTIVCIKDHDIAWSMPVNGGPCEKDPITCYTLLRPLKNGYLSIGYYGAKIDDNSLAKLLHPIVWR